MYNSASFSQFIFVDFLCSGAFFVKTHECWCVILLSQLSARPLIPWVILASLPFLGAMAPLPTGSQEGCRTPLSSQLPCGYLDSTGLRGLAQLPFEGRVDLGIVSSGVDFRFRSLEDKCVVNEGEFGNGKEADGVDNDLNGYVDDSKGWDALGRYSLPWDGFSGMGTFSASLVLASEVRNQRPWFEGIVPFARLTPVRVMADNGATNPKIMAAGLKYLATRGVQVVLLEAALQSSDRDELCGTLEELNAQQVLVIAPAGNSGDLLSERSLPASCNTQNLIVVAALEDEEEDEDGSGQLAKFSSFHPEWVHLAAPGSRILGLTNGGSLVSRTGTNGAAALVAAAALQLKARLGLTLAAEIKESLMKRAKLQPALQGKVSSSGVLWVSGEGLSPQGSTPW